MGPAPNSLPSHPGRSAWPLWPGSGGPFLAPAGRPAVSARVACSAFRLCRPADPTRVLTGIERPVRVARTRGPMLAALAMSLTSAAEGPLPRESADRLATRALAIGSIERAAVPPPRRFVPAGGRGLAAICARPRPGSRPGWRSTPGAGRRVLARSGTSVRRLRVVAGPGRVGQTRPLPIHAHYSDHRSAIMVTAKYKIRTF